MNRSRKHAHAAMVANAPLGLFYAWSREAPLPVAKGPPELTIERLDRIQRLPELGGLGEDVALRRLDGDHDVWLARIDQSVVAWGWAARRDAEIEGLDIHFAIPAGHRYLWDFVTSPKWRGRGIYPALLQAILRLDLDANRFWIGHDYENVASRRGILKAGFREIGRVHRTADGNLVYVAGEPQEWAMRGAELLGLPLANQ